MRCGDILRRFNAKVVDAQLVLSMHGLIDKIFALFKFAADTSIMLTYVDEDGDSVTLVDDDDLNDVTKQSPNPLRITVKLNAEKTGALPPPMCVKGPLIPLEQIKLAQSGKGYALFKWDSSRAKLLFQCPNHDVSETLENAPPFIRKRFVKLLLEPKDRDWSEIDTVVKIVCSDQTMLDTSDMVPPGSTPCEEIRSGRWRVFVLQGGGRKKEVSKINLVCYLYEFI